MLVAVIEMIEIISSKLCPKAKQDIQFTHLALQCVQIDLD